MSDRAPSSKAPKTGSSHWIDRIGSSDAIGGLAFLTLAVVGLLSAARLPGMRGFQFGPGTAPLLFAVALAASSTVLLLGALFRSTAERRGGLDVRGPACVLGAMVLFAFGVQTLGLLITGFLVVLLSSAATPEVRWGEALIYAALMSTGASLLFVVALKLPFSLWPVLG